MESYVEQAYAKAMMLFEQLGLAATHQRISEIYKEAKEEGFNTEIDGYEHEPYLKWRAPLDALLDSVSDYYSIDEIGTKVSRDLISIIQNSIYSITNPKYYNEVPQNEDDVHHRIEGILRCIFPDLKHKPSLTKPIKNFEPDTGIPSIHTLVEYKYISTETDAKRIVDEISPIQEVINHQTGRVICM